MTSPFPSTDAQGLTEAVVRGSTERLLDAEGFAARADLHALREEVRLLARCEADLLVNSRHTAERLQRVTSDVTALATELDALLRRAANLTH
ncbi:MAG: hypothetical protein JXX28_19200 [Deltaproteobacteria bacterium]|nr:hypothetical protein [Deltaproteobacteria bacterium]